MRILRWTTPRLIIDIGRGVSIMGATQQDPRIETDSNMERQGNKREPAAEEVSGNDETGRTQEGVPRTTNETSSENLGQQLKTIVAGEVRGQLPEFEQFVLRAVVSEKQHVRPLPPSATPASVNEEGGERFGAEWSLFWTVYGREDEGREEALIDRTTAAKAIAAYAAMTGDKKADSLRIANPQLLEKEVLEGPVLGGETGRAEEVSGDRWGEGRIEVGDTYISIRENGADLGDEPGEVVYWDIAEWEEDAQLTLTIARTIREVARHGIDAIRHLRTEPTKG